MPACGRCRRNSRSSRRRWRDQGKRLRRQRGSGPFDPMTARGCGANHQLMARATARRMKMRDQRGHSPLPPEAASCRRRAAPRQLPRGAPRCGAVVRAAHAERVPAAAEAGGSEIVAAIDFGCSSARPPRRRRPVPTETGRSGAEASAPNPRRNRKSHARGFRSTVPQRPGASHHAPIPRARRCGAGMWSASNSPSSTRGAQNVRGGAPPPV